MPSTLKLAKKTAARQAPVVGTPGTYRKAVSADGHRQIAPPLKSDTKNFVAPKGAKNAKQ